MDDSLLMSMLDCPANLDEKAEAFFRRERLEIAVIRNLHTPHQLHNEVRTTGFCRAGVEYLCDVGMIHQPERLPFSLISGQDTFFVHSRFDDILYFLTVYVL